jgi:hypothetical protein
MRMPEMASSYAKKGDRIEGKKRRVCKVQNR